MLPIKEDNIFAYFILIPLRLIPFKITLSVHFLFNRSMKDGYVLVAGVVRKTAIRRGRRENA